MKPGVTALLNSVRAYVELNGHELHTHKQASWLVHTLGQSGGWFLGRSLVIASCYNRTYVTEQTRR